MGHCVKRQEKCPQNSIYGLIWRREQDLNLRRLLTSHAFQPRVNAKLNIFITKNGLKEPFSFYSRVNISVKFAYNSVDLPCFIFCKNMFVAVFVV